MTNNKKLIRGILIIIIILAVISFMFIYSSSAYIAEEKNLGQWYFVKKQAIWYMLGFALMMIFRHIDYKRYKHNQIKIFLIGFFLLLAVLMFGKTVNGSRRWLAIFKYTIQPSEFAKILYILFFASLIEKYKMKKRTDPELIIAGLTTLGIYAGLIFLEKDLSTTFHLILISAIMFFATDIKIKYVITGFFVSISGAVLSIVSSKNRARRVIEYWEGIKKTGVGGGGQVKQSIIGIGNGGLFGTGFGKGLQKYNFLPEQHTDFIFSIIAEELGFILTTILLTIYLVFITIGGVAIFRVKSYYGKFVILGIFSMIITQVLLNIFVALGIIPATGIPLPFISAGGSSIVALLIGMGIVFNILSEGEN
ncbi:FtsW/RodA/SpoVE family cell cycle protein [Haliovirga abyssi]|uniref:Probable peptidoglycan glycosyltransferase FtsW n=1 Tax=Haliovirga abyssi TaxID=2996794 RepID=A0AAU9DE48_9FUSO|nr:FtsW/RodA/SpoVE family cell cycle protein [Haliovirga abyssi]BDU49597.1 stage V sporulation protein E [Haliovirga abyssi]